MKTPQKRKQTDPQDPGRSQATAHRHAPKKRMQKGFTLIELLVVAAIIAIITAIIVPAVATAKSDARQKRKEAITAAVELAKFRYALKNPAAGEDAFFSQFQEFLKIPGENMTEMLFTDKTLNKTGSAITDWGTYVAQNGSGIPVVWDGNYRSITDYDSVRHSHENLTGQDFSLRNYTNSNFTFSILNLADLSRSQFNNTLFQNVSFDGANLSHSIFQNSNLQNTTLEATSLDEVHIINTNLALTSFINVNMQKAVITGAGTNTTNTAFTNSNLQGATIGEGLNLATVTFVGSNLQQVVFTGSVNLTPQQLIQASHLQQADLRGTGITQTQFNAAVIAAGQSPSDQKYQNIKFD